jgi:endonuclease/exonuclease/phosphatase family metal-dependent hydrolase
VSGPRQRPWLRVMTYNIRSLRDDAAAVARVIMAAGPDLICIQEAPRFLRWRARCAALARAAGMVIAGGGRDAGANLLLVAPHVDVAQAASVLFSRDPGLHRRGAVLAVLGYRQQRFGVVGTHLDGVEEPRLRHIRELHEQTDRLLPAGIAVIVAGDINDQPGSPSWQALETYGLDAFAVAGVGDGMTSTPLRPARRIDAVFVGTGATVRRSQAIASADVRIASDHRPVITDVDLDPAAR